MRFAATIVFALNVAIVAGCVANDRFAEFRRYEKEVNGRFLGVLRFALNVPGVEDFEKHYSYQRDVFVIPNTRDYFETEAELDYNRRAEEFARRYNLRLLRQGKRPNQPPQHNAGSRPPSGDSSATETPSSLGPHG
jgi:hypothetical protein